MSGPWSVEVLTVTDRRWKNVYQLNDEQLTLLDEAEALIAPLGGYEKGSGDEYFTWPGFYAGVRYGR